MRICNAVMWMITPRGTRKVGTRTSGRTVRGRVFGWVVKICRAPGAEVRPSVRAMTRSRRPRVWKMIPGRRLAGRFHSA